MSEYTTRPEVRVVTAASQSDVSAGVVAASVAVGAVVAGLFRSAALALEATRVDSVNGRDVAAPADVLLSPKGLREQFAAEQQAAAELLLAEPRSRLDALKLATGLALQRTPYRTCGTSLEAPVAALLAAHDVDALRAAQVNLMVAVERGHTEVFIQHLSVAAAEASRAAGFEAVEIRPATNGLSARVIATDLAGRSLVSEVSRDRTGDVRLATEAVGITDGSCHAALDAFDDSLDRGGVRSGSPERTTTGGVCELPFAREFLRHRSPALKAKPHRAPDVSSGESERRPQPRSVKSTFTRR